MTKIFIKPAAGRRVRLHDGRLVPPEGWEVDNDAIWQRRLRDGDVVLAAAPASASAAASSSSPPKGLATDKPETGA